MNLSCMPHKRHRLLDFNLIHLQTSVKIETSRFRGIQMSEMIWLSWTHCTVLTERGIAYFYMQYTSWPFSELHPSCLELLAQKILTELPTGMNWRFLCMFVFSKMCSWSGKTELKLFFVGCNWVWNYKASLSAILLNYTVMWLNTVKNRGECLSQ